MGEGEPGALRCFEVPVLVKEESLSMLIFYTGMCLPPGTLELKIKSCSSEKTQLVLKGQKGTLLSILLWHSVSHLTRFQEFLPAETRL